MNPESRETAQPAGEDPSDIIIIRDPEIDVEALMAQVRANVAQRRAAGAYQEDLDGIAADVRAQVLGSLASTTLIGDPESGSPILSELEARWLISESDFSSNAPVFGPLIVGVRRAWNWMSTKWYVRGILDQQVGFNALVVQALAEAQGANKALAAQVSELRAECAQQAEEIAALQKRLGSGKDPISERSPAE